MDHTHLRVHQHVNNYFIAVVLCDTHETSILIVDTYATILPRYIVAVQNIVKRHKYRAYRRYRAARIT